MHIEADDDIPEAGQRHIGALGARNITSVFQPTQTFHVVTQQYADVEAEQNQVQGLALTYAKCLQALIQVLACMSKAGHVAGAGLATSM